MRVLAGILGALILLIQYPLWLGKGGWLRVAHMEREVDGQKAKNHELEVRNGALEAEVRDLKTGTEAIEERARYELGMVRGDEVFFQYGEPAKQAAPPAAQSSLSGSKNNH